MSTPLEQALSQNHALREHMLSRHIATAQLTTTGATLSALFNSRSGKFVSDDGTRVREMGATAFYQPPARLFGIHLAAPTIVAGPRISDLTIIHELRHHQQDLKAGLNKRRGLRDRCLIGSWAEADARAVEMLHALEKIENETQGAARPHVVETLINGTIPYNFSPLPHISMRLHNHYCIDKNPTLTRAEKMQTMREVFDNYLSRTNNITDPYRGSQLARTRKTRPLPLTIPAILLPFAAFGLARTGNILDFTVVSLTLQSALALVLRQSHAATKCDDSRSREESAEKLKPLGAMPHGEGNYLTDTRGLPLTDDFYHRLPQKLEEAVRDKKAELHKVAHPVAALKNKCAELAKNIIAPP